MGGRVNVSLTDRQCTSSKSEATHRVEPTVRMVGGHLQCRSNEIRLPVGVAWTATEMLGMTTLTVVPLGLPPVDTKPRGAAGYGPKAVMA